MLKGKSEVSCLAGERLSSPNLHLRVPLHTHVCREGSRREDSESVGGPPQLSLSQENYPVTPNNDST